VGSPTLTNYAIGRRSVLRAYIANGLEKHPYRKVAEVFNVVRQVSSSDNDSDNNNSAYTIWDGSNGNN